MSNEQIQGVVKVQVPGRREFVLVIRTALGGVALLTDLDVDQMDDLRTAADEACDWLLHQKREAEALSMEAVCEGDKLRVSLSACFTGGENAPCEDMRELSSAILETLIPEVTVHEAPCGCVERIDLMLPRAVK